MPSALYEIGISLLQEGRDECRPRRISPPTALIGKTPRTSRDLGGHPIPAVGTFTFGLTDFTHRPRYAVCFVARVGVVSVQSGE
ncbi:hypothetical protein [Cupriavidus consociatus]|uniref:hypothetical protein n=1 Tax=Cupriavidus consociatus TaxID=2821357 RepID=UPI001AE7991B|nr:MULTISPECIES: hypothetical protein [unclassified Cupriavidus]MBP0622926.1 hypothetical protein [Cupriavidus sp. LEh25]MDK2659614.1 hypothetical protein [Cupriavidus sp. LEh21]